MYLFGKHDRNFRYFAQQMDLRTANRRPGVASFREIGPRVSDFQAELSGISRRQQTNWADGGPIGAVETASIFASRNHAGDRRHTSLSTGAHVDVTNMVPN